MKLGGLFHRRNQGSSTEQHRCVQFDRLEFKNRRSRIMIFKFQSIELSKNRRCSDRFCFPIPYHLENKNSFIENFSQNWDDYFIERIKLSRRNNIDRYIILELLTTIFKFQSIELSQDCNRCCCDRLYFSIPYYLENEVSIRFYGKFLAKLRGLLPRKGYHVFR